MCHSSLTCSKFWSGSSNAVPRVVVLAPGTKCPVSCRVPGCPGPPRVGSYPDTNLETFCCGSSSSSESLARLNCGRRYRVCRPTHGWP
eukprot:1745422-Rhodomonas_salina.3